jgi:chitin synthase
MSLPRRPEASESPLREQRGAYRSSPRRPRAQDEETGYFSVSNAPVSPSRHQHVASKSSYAETLGSPLTPIPTNDPIISHSGAPSGGDMHRKRSLIRPERNRIDRDHPNYHYRQHAARMDILPSSTGNDPIIEDMDPDTAATETSGLRSSQEAESDISPI